MRKASKMTRAEIQTELGWSDEMIRLLLPEPDSPSARRDKATGAYTRGLYERAHVLAIAQTEEVLVAKWHWDRTVFGGAPAPGWTMRLGDIGRELGINAVPVGRILQLMGLRSRRQVTESAVVAGFGVRRWDGYRTYHDWHQDRAVAAIKAAACRNGDSAVANALEAAVVRQQAMEQGLVQRRRREEAEAARRREEENVIVGQQAELVALRAIVPGMSLLTAVEYITADPGQRFTLYRSCCGADRDTMPGDWPSDGSSAANDLALLGRRAKAEGFRIDG